MSVGSSGSESEEEVREAAIQGIPQIAIDLFVRKNSKRLRFTDAFGNLVYKLVRNANGTGTASVLFDPSGNPLISIFRTPDGSWQAFKGDACGQDLLFTVYQTLNTFTKTEFNIFIITQGQENLAFTLRGCVFWRSCTIYQHNSILAQTNLMYTLGFRKIFVRRDKFRVTVFPGFADYNFIAALIFIFLDGRRQ